MPHCRAAECLVGPPCHDTRGCWLQLQQGLGLGLGLFPLHAAERQSGSSHSAPVLLACTVLVSPPPPVLLRPAPAGRDSQLPEYKIAASRGFELEAPLGSGHFGRVYKARSNATGQVGWLAGAPNWVCRDGTPAEPARLPSLLAYLPHMPHPSTCPLAGSLHRSAKLLPTPTLHPLTHPAAGGHQGGGPASHAALPSGSSTARVPAAVGNPARMHRASRHLLHRPSAAAPAHSGAHVSAT